MKQNDICGGIAMATLLAQVVFCQKPNIPISNPLMCNRGSCSGQTCFHMVLTLLIRLLGVDGIWLDKN